MESLFKAIIKAAIQGVFVGVLGSILLGVFISYIPEQYETLVFWMFVVIAFIVIDYAIPNPTVKQIAKYFTRAKN